MIKKYLICALVIVGLCCVFAEKNIDSIENVDYAVSISILDEGAGSSNEGAKIRLYVANLMDYRGSSEQMLETNEYTYEVNNVSEIFELYERENGRPLSLSHVRKISVDELWEQGEACVWLLPELAEYVDMTDEVKLEAGDESTGLLSYMRR